jgi:D-beta-D-heptose 7-phosphate kinase/D-beta-D-heptose 1-phosphate adenosyltransferase
MLDQYWWGSVERISPEAPVPVVRLDRTSVVPGGAANVAANIEGLGATPILVGCIGTDAEGDQLKKHLASNSISSKHLIEIADRPTSVKTRVVAHSQHVVRVDRETINSITSDAESKLIALVRQLLDSVDLLIISDYAKGSLTLAVLESAIQDARGRNIPVLIDPKGKDYLKFKGASVITPNRREAAEACSLDEHRDDVVRTAGRRLLSELDLAAIIITEGEKGMTLFESNGNETSFKAEAHEIYDVTGAGDTVIAALGVAMAAGVSLIDAVRLANTAASLVVEQVGTTAISSDRLFEKLEANSMTLIAAD